MAKLEFEYDETGDKFLYFIVGLYSILILPLTYFLWPIRLSNQDDGDSSSSSFHPNLHDQYEPLAIKSRILNRDFGRKHRFRNRVRSIVVAIAWIMFASLVYCAFRAGSRSGTGNGAYDPYSILEIDPAATDGEIKTAYRKMAKLHHPDRSNCMNFMFRALKTLKTHAITDNVTRYNWKKYGNPDGPGVVRFGIALPKWLIDERYSAFVLAAYVVVLIICLPVGVGLWWYRSGRYAVDAGGILLGTSRLYWAFVIRSPSMNIQRAFMLLSGSTEYQDEFSRGEVRERPSDNEDIPRLITDLSSISSCVLGGVSERCREIPFCAPYSIKCRTLILAHVNRIDMSRVNGNLCSEQRYMVRMAPFLIAELVQVAANVNLLVQVGQLPARSMTKVETIENIMKMSALIVQSLKRPISCLQLPFIGTRLSPRNLQVIKDVELDSLAKMEDSVRRNERIE
ncbi:hypothetical protein ACOME3_006243 [Neoechinorhynchus agilis]